MSLSLKIRAAFAVTVAILLGMGISAFLQTYALEGDPVWVAHTWDTIGRLDALDSQIKDAESSCGRLATAYSAGDAARCRAAAAMSRQLASAVQSASVPRIVFDELDAIDRGLDANSAEGIASAVTSAGFGQISDRVHRTIHDLGMRERRSVLDRLDLENSVVRFARVLLELTSALSVLMIALIAWQSPGAKVRATAERTIAAKEEQYRQVVEMAGDIICRTDREGRFTFCNQTALSMLHFTEDEVVGRSWLKLIRYDKRAEVKRFYLRQFARRTANTYYEFPVIDGHGRERWLGQNVQLLCENDVPMAFQAIAREITERKRAEYEIERTRSFVERIAATTPGILYVYDLEDRRNIYSNREIISALGYKPTKDLRIHPDDAAALQAHHDSLRTALEGEVRKIEYRVQHAAGNWVWLASSDTPFERNHIGLVKRIVGVAQDITARKATEEKLTRRADFDALTGLPNRYHFGRLLQSTLRRAAIELSPVCFCILDIDRFGSVNDRYGSAAADEVLRQTGKILRSELRERDAAGRLGGDEMGFILANTELPEAIAVANRICARIAELRFGSGSYGVTATTGVAEWRTAMEATELMDAAERSLYRAKSDGHKTLLVDA